MLRDLDISEDLNVASADMMVYAKREFKNADVIIVEGILIFYDVRVRDIFELKIFVDCDADTGPGRSQRSG